MTEVQEEKLTKKKRSPAELKAFHQSRIAEIDREAEVRIKRKLIDTHHQLQQLAIASNGKPYAQGIAKQAAECQALAAQIKVDIPQ